MSEDMPLAKQKNRHIELIVNTMGMGTTKLDGLELGSYISEVHIRARIGHPTEVVLVFPAVNVTAEVEAIFKAHRPHPLDDLTTLSDTHRRFSEDQQAGGEG